MEEKLIDTNGLAEMMSLHIKTVQQIIRQSENFPKAIVFGKNARRWKYSEILEWIDKNRASETDP
jgi:predicted DNA-binding transcriptional regulator AlpA